MQAKTPQESERIMAVVNGNRCLTGIDGLDNILAGGLERNCFYLIQGDPGSGKTTLALQFLLEGLREHESVFYVTLAETKQELDLCCPLAWMVAGRHFAARVVGN